MIRVGVVRGGVSREYDLSLKTGGSVLQILREHFPSSYKAIDILITKDGIWHIAGRPISSDELVSSVDVVWNGLHGEYGEDGALQAQLEALNIPYTGSGPVASAFGSNPELVKEKIRELGLHPGKEYIVKDFRKLSSASEMSVEEYFARQVAEIFTRFSPPWIVKIHDRKSELVKTREDLYQAFMNFSEKPGDIVVKEYVAGKKVSIFLADQFRGNDVYTFLPLGDNLSQIEKQAVEKYAVDLYVGLGLRHYAKIDFILTSKKTYVTKVELLPEIGLETPLHRSLDAVGAYLPEFIDHILQLAIPK